MKNRVGASMVVHPPGTSQSRSRMNVAWWAMVPVLLLPAWFSIREMTYDTLWVDEILTYRLAGGAQYGPISITRVIHNAFYYDVWPPLYHLAFHLWGELAGWTPFAGRYLPFLLGWIVIALVYRFGRETHSHAAGLLAAITISTSPFFVYYLHELRGYTLHVLMALLVLRLYWHIIAREQRAPRWQRLALVFSVAGLLYSHAFGSLIIASLVGYHFLFARRSHQWSHMVFLIGIGGLLYLPWLLLPALATLVAETNSSRGAMSTIEVLKIGLRTFGNGLSLPLVLIAGFGVWQVRNRGAGMLAFVLIAVSTLALALNVTVEYLFHIRHMLALTPLVALLPAMALAELGKSHWLIPAAVAAVWLATGIYHIHDRAFMEDQPGTIEIIRAAPFEEATDFIIAHTAPEDATFFQIGTAHNEQFNHVVLDYYLGTTDVRFAQPGIVAHVQPDVRDLPYSEKFDDFVNGSPAIWTVTMPAHFPANDLRPLLSEMQNRAYQRCGRVFENSDFVITAYRNDSCDSVALTADAP